MSEQEEQEVKEIEQNAEEQKPESETSETPTEEVVVVETSSKPELKGFRKRMSERALRENDETDFYDDEQYETYLNKVLDMYEDADKNLASIFEDYPEFKDMIGELKNGKPLRAVIASNFDTADLVPDVDDDDYDAWQKAKAERKSRRDADDAFRKEVEDNMNEANGVIDMYIVDKDYDDEKKQAIIEKVNEIAGNLYKGKITPEFLDLVNKGLNFEDAVEMAAQAGVIKGRNENIEAKMENDRVNRSGDGLPTPTDKGYKPKMIKGNKAVIDFGSIFNS